MEKYQKNTIFINENPEIKLENEARICNFDPDFKSTDNMADSVIGSVLHEEKKKENLQTF